MTYEEAIKVLRWALNWLDGHNYIIDGYGTVDPSAKVNAFAKAIEALNKQIPHKPVGRHTDYRCSVCGTRVRSGQGSSSRTRDTVCRKCYTVIDWSADEET